MRTREMVYYDEAGQVTGVDYKGFIVPLIAEVKKLKEEIEILKKR